MGEVMRGIKGISFFWHQEAGYNQSKSEDEKDHRKKKRPRSFSGMKLVKERQSVGMERDLKS